MAQNETGIAIRMLHDLLKNSPKLDEAILQSAQHHDIMQQVRSGLVNNEQANLTKNQIRGSILALLKDMEENNRVEGGGMKITDKEVADEFEEITQKIKTNRGAGTSEGLKGKNASDLDEQELKRFFSRVRTEKRFSDTGIDTADLSVQQKLLRLSLAENGHLHKGTFFCLGQINQIESISHAATESKFAIFKGTTRNHFLVLETVRGNLIQQYEKMLLLLQQHIALRRDVLKSEDTYAIPFIAFKELVANAFIHRSYDSDVQSTIQVELFDDRLEIKSPGLFPDNVDLDNIELSFIINPVVAAIFFLYGHIEKSGTGINRAKAALMQQGMKAPLLFQNPLQKYVKITIFKGDEQ